MCHVRDVMRMKAAGMASREIARRVGAAPSTVRLTIRRFEAAGLTWPLPDDVTDAVLEARLFAGAGCGSPRASGAWPSRTGRRCTASASASRRCRSWWEEYIATEPGEYRCSRFCELYRAREGRLSVTMRVDAGVILPRSAV
jgi:transposase